MISCILLSTSLLVVGTINRRAVRGIPPMTPELEQKYLDIPFSIVAMLVGLIDGDGMFAINRSQAIR